ncbi:MAG: SDR family oxidoreductase [Vibrio sp.]
MDLANKRILITGACGGIGSAIADHLAEHGAKLILVGRSPAKLESLKTRLMYSDYHQSIVADLSSFAGLDTIKAEAQAIAENGGIDVVINNAGYNQFDWLSQRQPHDVNDELFLNLTSPILLAQSALEWLNRPGIILNIGSTLGSIGHPGYSSYCAAKAGLHRFSEALDRELHEEGLRVLYLAPRTTSTSLNSSLVEQMNAELGNQSDSPIVVAQHVRKVLKKEIAQHWIGSPEKWFVKINQWFPSLVSRELRKHHQTITRFIQRRHQEN